MRSDLAALTLAALADSTSASSVKRVADMPTCVVAVLRNPDEDLATLSKPPNVKPVGVALSAKDPRFQGLADNLVDAFEMTGRLDELRSRWIEDGPGSPSCPERRAEPIHIGQVVALVLQ